MPGPARAAFAGSAYAVALFVVGSAVGVVRVLALEPRFGALDSTVYELPLMLGVAWLICASLISRCAVNARAFDRLAMGACAFLLLLSAEFGFAWLLGRHLDFGSPAPVVGLAGQVAAAMLPLVQLCLFPRRRRTLP